MTNKSSHQQARQEVVQEDIAKRFPNMRPQMQGELGRLIEAENWPKERVLFPDEINEQIQTRRAEIASTISIGEYTDPDAENPSQEALKREFEEMMGYLYSLESVPEHFERMREIMNDLNCIKLKSEYISQLFDALRPLADEAALESPRVFQQLLLTFATPAGLQNDYTELIEGCLLYGIKDLVANGRLNYAQELSVIAHRSRSAGYKGKSYYDNFSSIHEYDKYLKKGYKLTASDQDYLTVMSYLEEARRNNIDLSDVTAELPENIQREIESIEKDGIPLFAA
jgi:hypothetical protein